jgi:hypothetical protein
VAILVHKSIVGSVVKKIMCNDRLIAVKLNAESVSVLIVQVFMPTSDYEMKKWKNYMIESRIYWKRMEKITQTLS